MLDGAGRERRVRDLELGLPNHTAEISPLVLHILARELADDGLQYSEKPFQLRAGGESYWYYDGRNAVMQYHPGMLLAKLTALKIQLFGKTDFTRVAGMGVGGWAFARSISWVVDLPVVEGNDDKSPNQRYGYGLWGGTVPGENVLVADDTLTTGDSLRTLIGMVRDKDGIVDQAAVVTDRSNGEAGAAIYSELGVRVFSLFQMDGTNGLITPDY